MEKSWNVTLDLNCSNDCDIWEANRVTIFTKASAKLYFPVVTISAYNNAKLLQQLKWAFKGTINWNKYHSKKSTKAQNWYLDKLINPSFQGENRSFV